MRYSKCKFHAKELRGECFVCVHLNAQLDNELCKCEFSHKSSQHAP